MAPFFKLYMAGWACACGIALVAYARKRAAFAISSRRYWHFIAEPWKLTAFVAAAALFTVIAPYTGDPTWDHADGAFMSVLCFATAPWVAGTLYRLARGRAGMAEGYVALCAWLFSASWSYDAYLLWRDGHYPATWHANLLASSVIYLSAGLFWNLEWEPGKGAIFSFMKEDWPVRPAASSPWRIALYAAVFAAPAVLAVLVFLL
jgi:hypothetical protein